MTKYVVPIDTPPSGEDWSTVVPGIYLWDVIGITAQLSTGTGDPFTMVDSSGNGWNGAYNPSGIYPTSVPGLVAGDTAKYFGPSNSPNVPANAQADGAILDPNDDFTIEWWMQMDTGYVTIGKAFQFGNAFPVSPVQISMDNTGNVDAVRQGSISQQDASFDASGIIDDGLPHYYAVTFTASDIRLWIDANEITPFITDPLAGTVAPMPYVRINDPDFDGGLAAIFDEVALYTFNLPGAVIGQHYNAAQSSFADYTAAVLADGPAAYYHLDEQASTGRQPTLLVGNGTDNVLAIPTGFEAVTTPGPYGYAWQPGLNADTQSTDGTLTTVAIPALVIPAGYTVGTQTLDIQPTDQWSNVALWWDDSVQQLLGNLDGYEYGAGAHLLYHQIGT